MWTHYAVSVIFFATSLWYLAMHPKLRTAMSLVIALGAFMMILLGSVPPMLRTNSMRTTTLVCLRNSVPLR